jgi:hypothetical protein
VTFSHTSDRPPDGKYVKAGDLIAHVGYAGNVSPKGPAGAHLHAEYHPTTKGTWNCNVHANPAPVWAYKAASAPEPTPPPTTGGGTGPFVTASIQSNKLGMGEPTNGDTFSDTVKELQERLNRVKLVGGTTLIVDGKYGVSTDAEVRRWQDQICHDQPDPALKSYLGPAQRARMFPSPPYTIHNVGLPAVAGGGGGGVVPPPVDGGGGDGGVVPITPPAAPALALPGAVWDPIPKSGGGYFTGLRPFKGTAKKVTLHTTETANKPNWAAQQTGIPHLTINLNTKERWQHLKFDTAAYTLQGGEHSPNSDSGVNIQIEIIGYAAQSPSWADATYDDLKKILLWLSVNVEIPYVFPVAFPPHHRLSWAEWEPMSGILGHSMATWNSHTDPGALDVARLTASSVDPEPPIVPPAEGGADAELRSVLSAGFRRLADEIEAL